MPNQTNAKPNPNRCHTEPSDKKQEFGGPSSSAGDDVLRIIAILVDIRHLARRPIHQAPEHDWLLPRLRPTVPALPVPAVPGLRSKKTEKNNHHSLVKLDGGTFSSRKPKKKK